MHAGGYLDLTAAEGTGTPIWAIENGQAADKNTQTWWVSRGILSLSLVWELNAVDGQNPAPLGMIM